MIADALQFAAIFLGVPIAAVLVHAAIGLALDYRVVPWAVLAWSWTAAAGAWAW